ncbi:MAG TPA: hydroxymethylbilane synthase [Methylococcaceae bacterium]|nr:hydroxymethylbilane synthase [Methylococcaceae bacterium]HIL39416.1 hydroxymethylbilane synthase [Methylococcales bacterium]
MNDQLIRIATRNSPLALWQANYIAEQLRRIHPGLKTELIKMTTLGDKILDAPLAKIGGKGLFVKELEQGLLEGRADIAVHSMKDVPVDFPEGLELKVILAREDPCDALVSNHYRCLDDLPSDARIGTSSLRRQSQITQAIPGCQILPLRGNVNTRLAKLDTGQFDAIILAAAGLKRLAMADRIRQIIPTSISLPAVGQGALGIECRVGDDRIADVINVLHDNETQQCVIAERAMNERLEGGCQVPIAGFARFQDGGLFMQGLVGTPNGQQIIRAQRQGLVDQAKVIGYEIAEELLAKGAKKILQAIYS